VERVEHGDTIGAADHRLRERPRWHSVCLKACGKWVTHPLLRRHSRKEDL
jgi:ABC-type uncharacterized transport system substrate-binding protein